MCVNNCMFDIFTSPVITMVNTLLWAGINIMIHLHGLPTFYCVKSNTLILYVCNPSDLKVIIRKICTSYSLSVFTRDHVSFSITTALAALYDMIVKTASLFMSICKFFILQIIVYHLNLHIYKQRLNIVLSMLVFTAVNYMLLLCHLFMHES